MPDLKQLITIPQYYMKYCDSNVDLDKTSNIPCKFHGEQHGKSFTYSPSKKVWRCWGQCHCGGDVVELHKLNFRLRSRQEAEKSLAGLLGVKLDAPQFGIKPEVHIDDRVVEEKRLIQKAIRKAKTVEEWLELDYIMSQYPVDIGKVRIFCEREQ